jgi:CSLREA domain-containing protein
MFTKKLFSRIFPVLLIGMILFGNAAFPTSVRARGTTVHFAKPSATGSGNCSSWENACTLQTALTGAAAGEVLWVMAGTHKPTTGADRTATFQLKNGVVVFGGFAGTETDRYQRNLATNVTTLSGDLLGNDNSSVKYDEPTRADNSYHVVTGATSATLDGFTITAGNANGTGGNYWGGGMINMSSDPTLTNITFSNNSAERGSGMVNYLSSPELTNVTFNGNSAGYYGGGMLNEHGSSPVLTNVTFSGNTAGQSAGGILNGSNSSPRFINVTFSNNSAKTSGGGMFNWENSDPQIDNTIFWGNTAPAGAQIFNSSSTPILNDSVVQGGCPTGSTCASIITTDPMLGALGDYGGFTRTIPLLPDSPAIDTGNDATCAIAEDQRGVQRPQGAHCDIGAVEAIPQTLGVGNFADTNDGSCTPDCTLREAINAGNFGIPGVLYTVTFPLSPGLVTIELGSALPAVKNNLYIHGPGVEQLMISGNNLYRVLTVNSGASLWLSNVTIANGQPSSGHGGGIDVAAGGTLTVTDCKLTDNAAPGSGGAIHNGGGSLDITRVTFSDNQANYGGAIDNGEGSLSITTSAFEGNTANNGGGAINNYHSSSHPVLITNSSFSNNDAFYGGGVRNQGDGTLSITNSTFSSNTGSEAGAVNNYQGTTIITNSTFSGNSASGNGGSLSNSGGGTLNVTHGTFSSSNTSASGTVYNFGGTVTFRNSILAHAGGTNCTNSGTLTADTYNLATDTSCAAATFTSLANMKLAALANNGGPTSTIALLSGSSAMDTGNAAVCASDVGAPNYGAGGFDQRGVTRPQGAGCDIGAFEQGNSAPTDIALSNNSVAESLPTGTLVGNLSSTDSNPGDTHIYSFACTVPGANDGSFSITGDVLKTAVVFDYETKNTYGICIRTDDGNGGTFDKAFTINITDTAETLTAILRSAGAQDGWVLESTETSKKGGTLDNAATTLRLGDNNLKKQYRSILSFSTGASLPDDAVITKVTLKVKKQGITGGGNPVTTFQGFKVDIKKGLFGTSALQTTDFQTPASKTYGPFVTTIGGGWYTINLTSGKGYINKLSTPSALTQIRLYFQLDDNNNAVANYLSLYSGDAPAGSQPQLIIEYHLP